MKDDPPLGNLRRTHRITVTEALLSRMKCRSVLEIGSSDYSFRHARPQGTEEWITLDFKQPCDVECDLDDCQLQIPLAEATFDLVICTEVLEHLLWPTSLLGEVRRVLKPGGKLLVSVPNIVSLSYRVAWLLGHIPSCASAGNLPRELGGLAYEIRGSDRVGGHVIDFNKKRCCGLLALSGFHMEKVMGSGLIWHRQLLPHWVVPASLSSNIVCVARKPT
jgi:SAM-dependent methyltransferase